MSLFYRFSIPELIIIGQNKLNLAHHFYEQFGNIDPVPMFYDTSKDNDPS
jgi:hypothetical protein